jgi:hypothetical protein
MAQAPAEGREQTPARAGDAFAVRVSGPRLLFIGKATVMALLTLLSLLLIFVLEDVPFLSAAKNDEATVQAFTTYGGARLGDDAESFENTGRFFSAISRLLNLDLFLFLAAATGISLAIVAVKTVAQLMLVGLYLLIAVLLDLSYVSKDLIVILCGLVPLALFHWANNAVGRRADRFFTAAIILSAALLLLYGYTIRTYYLLIVGAAVGLYVLCKLPLWFRLWLVGSGVAILLAGFWDHLGSIQALRDEVNLPRVFHPAEGGRSAFLNPYPTDSFEGVILNVGYAAARLFLPVAFGGTVKDLIFEPFILVFLYCCFCGLVSGSRPAQWGSCILLGYLSIAVLFEPDVGSFARHAASLFPFAVLAMTSRSNGALPARAPAAGA